MIVVKRGGEVAIVQQKWSLPGAVLEIAVVTYEGPAIAELKQATDESELTTRASR
jgi:hypothetical protein